MTFKGVLVIKAQMSKQIWSYRKDTKFCPKMLKLMFQSHRYSIRNWAIVTFSGEKKAFKFHNEK